MHILDSRTARILATICVFIAVAAFLYGIRDTLVVFLFAIFFAYLLEPLVSRIEATRLARHSRGLAIVEAYLCLVVGLGGTGFLLGPSLLRDSRHLGQSLPSLLDNLGSGKIVWQVGSKHGWSYETQVQLAHLMEAHRAEILGWIAHLGAQVAQFLTNIVWLALIPILAIFFLHDGREFAQNFIGVFDRGAERRLLRSILNDLDRLLARFIFAQILVGACSFCAYALVLTVMRFPYALALALAGGIMEFIPVVGPLVAAGAILGVGFLSAYSPLWAVLIFLATWRVSLDYGLTPRIMGHGLELHPLVAIAAVLMGAELGGILGVYLSIPIAATLRVIWNNWKYYSSGLPQNSQAKKPVEVSPRGRAVR